MNRFQQLVVCLCVFCGSFSHHHQAFARIKNTPSSSFNKKTKPTPQEYIYDGVLEGPLFDCPNVLTSLGESISNYVQCIASIIELQKQCLISLEKQNMHLKQHSKQQPTNTSQFFNYILSSKDEITLTMLIDIPEIGVGEFDRHQIDKTISMASLVDLINTSSSPHRNNEIVSSSTPTTIKKKKSNMILFKKGRRATEKDLPPPLLIHEPIIINRLSWDEVAAKQHDNTIPIPWKLWNETVISMKSPTNELNSIVSTYIYIYIYIYMGILLLFSFFFFVMHDYEHDGCILR
jgi:hypothetical protein